MVTTIEMLPQLGPATTYEVWYLAPGRNWMCAGRMSLVNAEDRYDTYRARGWQVIIVEARRRIIKN